MANNILDQLVDIAGTKSRDGSYNQLVKDANESLFLQNEDYHILTTAFRDQKQADVCGDIEGYTTSYDNEGHIVPTSIQEILARAYHYGASDIHISSGTPPKMRLHGELLQMPYSFLTPSKTEELLKPLLSSNQIKMFEENGDLDFAYSLPEACRFRVNMLKQKGTWAAVFRCLSNRIPLADELGLPKVVQELASKKRGLVLVTGPTGSGKSTTLASIIRIINETRRENIITLEDPIEYIHENKFSTILQREMGLDSKSFAAGIRASLREDPDVILIGEMRDPETIATAITAAETGHLVFSTLHTIGAAPTIDRIIDSFPSSQQNQIRAQLSSTLEAVISQQLVPNVNENGRVAAFEVMLANNAIRSLIRENKVPQMVSTMQTNRASGMITMDDYLMTLYYQGTISGEKAIEFAIDKVSMKQKIGL